MRRLIDRRPVNEEWRKNNCLTNARVGPYHLKRVRRHRVEALVTVVPATAEIPVAMPVPPAEIPMPAYLLPPRTGVYFLQCGDVVKIGCAHVVDARVRGIQGVLPSPSCLLGVIETDTVDEAKTLERSLHRQFRAVRVRGEWFECQAVLKAGCIPA